MIMIIDIFSQEEWNRKFHSFIFDLCFSKMIVFLLLLSVVEALDLSCKDLQGRKVDWFVAYKLPDGISGLRNSGKSFIYFDSRSSSWVPSAKKIDDPDSAIGKTLGQLWEVKRDSELLYAVYNDDHPDKGNKSLSDSFRAHMKGALAFDDFTGFWMSYSVPNFVDLSKRKYSFPDTGTKYGQTFMCLTLSVTQLKEIGDYLYFSQPSIVRTKVPTSFKKLFKNLDNALSEKRFTTKNGPLSSFEFIETLAGTKIAAFSKNKKIQKDIYKDLIGPNLQVPLAVESWLLGSAKNLPSSCGSNTVLNIKEVTLNVNGKPYIFQSSKDHSKWAISGNSNKPIVCIGDNNRQESQLGRGGGALCISNKQLWSQFRNSIAKLECCGGREASSC